MNKIKRPWTVLNNVFFRQIFKRVVVNKLSLNKTVSLKQAFLSQNSTWSQIRAKMVSRLFLKIFYFKLYWFTKTTCVQSFRLPIKKYLSLHLKILSFLDISSWCWLFDIENFQNKLKKITIVWSSLTFYLLNIILLLHLYNLFNFLRLKLNVKLKFKTSK